MVSSSRTVKWMTQSLPLTSSPVARTDPSDLRSLLWERLIMYVICFSFHITQDGNK